VVGDRVVAIPEHRVTAVANFRQPVTRKDLRSFMGAIFYCKKFVSEFAEYSSQLSPATSKKAASKV